MLLFIGVLTLFGLNSYFSDYFHSLELKDIEAQKPTSQIIREYCSDESRNDQIKELYGTIGGCVSVLSMQEAVRLQGEISAYQRANAITSRIDQITNRPQTSCTTTYLNGTAYTNCR